MTPFAIAAMQLYTSAVHDNLPRLRTRLQILMELYPWVQMVVFSELATYGPLQSTARELPCPGEQEYCDLAKRHSIWLIPGSFYELKDGKIYNTAPVINPDGEVIARYRKMFPFYPYEVGIEPGRDFVVFDVPGAGRFGVTICYDLWFPEVSRTLASMGAEVILRPTLTSTIDRDVELAITRSTAAINQCFVIDVNGLGDGGNGRSLIVGPAGDVLYQAGTAEEMIPIEINLDRPRRSREVGLRGLGQPLKSFRDRKAVFPVYAENGPGMPYLDTLGPLEKPQRGSRAGLVAADSPGPEAASTGVAKGIDPPHVAELVPDPAAADYEHPGHPEEKPA